jgi:hypothetical protein
MDVPTNDYQSRYPEISQLEDEWYAGHPVRAPRERRPWTAEDMLAHRVASRKLEAAREAARDAFAAKRGWRWTKSWTKWFSLDQLREGRARRSASDRLPDEHSALDHPEYLWAGDTPIGIVSHSYATWQRCAEFADSEGLNIELLSGSWYRPPAPSPCCTRRASNTGHRAKADR